MPEARETAVAAPTGLFLDPRWLHAVIAEGLVFVGPRTRVAVELEAPYDARRRLLEGLLEGWDPAALAETAGATPADAQALIERLREAGAMTPQRIDAARPDGAGLTDAILAAAGGRPVVGSVWTGDELLVLPDRADPAISRRALRAFVAGIADDARRRAYAYVATWRAASAGGDLPDPRRASAALEAVAELDPGAVHVYDLEREAGQSLEPELLGRLGADRCHRLGVIVSESTATVADGSHLAVAAYASPNLTRPSTSSGGLGRGVADDSRLARRIARAEAAERYAAGDAGAHELVRATAAELERVVPPDAIFAMNRRQLARRDGYRPFDPDRRYLWARAQAADGSDCWVPAAAVFSPFQDPEDDEQLALLTTSSGVAAHDAVAEAAERAFCELIERDAFIWHWIQRLSRERIDRSALPEPVAARLKAVERAGFEAELVNLTLETRPVIMCVLIGHGWVVVGAACHPDPGWAAAKALGEAASIASASVEGDPEEPIAAEDVRTPHEHLRLHHDAGLEHEDRFLLSSSETIALADVSGTDVPLLEALAPIGEPLTVDLSTSSTAPFHVVRALVPGLIPITFGYDREPLGMPALGRPRRTVDGRPLGRELDLAEAGPLLPHPFA